MLYAIVALLVIILDQWTKFWVYGNIALNTGSRPLIPGLLQLVNIHNDGAALGFLSGKNAGMFFIILCAVFTIFVIVALATRLVKSSVGRWSLLFIMAGGLSNCIDRVLNGYVQDMFMPTFMDNLPIFNVADIFITVFCLVFILYVLFGGRGDDDYDEEDEEEEYVDEDEEVDDLEDEEELSARRIEREETRAKGLGFLFGRRGEDDEDEDEEEEEDDEEEDEEDEDDELPPAGRPSRYDRAARNGKRPVKSGGLGRLFSRGEEDDEDEDEDEEEEEPVRRKPQKAEKRSTTRRDRQAELDEKYARFKAERAEREKQWAAPTPEEKLPVVDPADPFAEWDAANAAQAQTPPEPPAVPAAQPEVPAAQPEAPAAPAAPKAPAKSDESMEFSLEDILAEFK